MWNVIPLWVWFASSLLTNVLSNFYVLIGRLCSFEEMSIQVLCPFLSYFSLLTCKSFMCSEYSFLTRCMICKYFLPFCGLSFLFLNSVCVLPQFTSHVLHFYYLLGTGRLRCMFLQGVHGLRRKRQQQYSKHLVKYPCSPQHCCPGSEPSWQCLWCTQVFDFDVTVTFVDCAVGVLSKKPFTNPNVTVGNCNPPHQSFDIVSASADFD